MFEVGKVLEPYSSGGKFAVLGFGGIPLYLEDKELAGKVSKCWYLNGTSGDFDNSQVSGVMRMLAVYH